MLPKEANKIVEQLCLLQSENENLSINSILPILDQIPFPVHILDNNEIIIACNNSFKSTFGNIYENKKSTRDFIASKEKKCEVTKNIPEKKMEYKLGSIENIKRIYNFVSYKIVDKKGKATNHIEIIYNVLQSDESEFNLNESIIQYRELFDTLPVGIFKITKDGDFIYANSYLIKLLGFENYNELTKYKSFDFLQNKDIVDEILSSIEQSELDSWAFNDKFKDIKGNTVYAKNNVKAIKDENNKVLYYEVVLTDISVQRHTANTSSLLSKTYSDSNNNATSNDLLSAMCNEVMNMLHSDHSFLALYDFEKDEYYSYCRCCNKEVCNENSKIDLNLSDTLLDYVRQLGIIQQVDNRLRTNLLKAGKIKKDGTPFNKWIGIPLINSNNLTIGVISIECRENFFFDNNLLSSINRITQSLVLTIENKRSLAIIKSQSEKYRDIIDGVDEGILYVDKKGIILEANWQFLKMGNVTREHVIGVDASVVAKQIIHKDDVQILLKLIEENLQGKPTTNRVVLRDLQSNIYEFYSFTNENKEGITGVIRDITEEEKLKSELKKAKEKAEEAYGINTALLNIYQSSYQSIGKENLISTLCDELATVIPDFKFGAMYYDYHRKKNNSGKYLCKSNSREQTESLISYVRKTKKTLFLNKNEIIKLFNDKVLIGHMPEVNFWMAYPILDSEYNIIAIIEAIRLEENIPTKKDYDNFLLMTKGIGVILSNKIAQSELKKSERLYLNIFEGVRDGIVYLGKDGVIVNVNDSFCKKVLMPKDKLVGAYISDIAQTQLDKDESLEAYLKVASNTVDGKETKKEVFHNIRGDVFEVSVYTDTFQSGATAVFRDITKETAFKSELIEARRQAEEGERLKTAFLSNISHEIRTPMNGILGFSSILLRENVSAEKQASFFKIIFNSTKQLLSILNDILDISKIEAGKVNFKLSTFDVNELMTDLYTRFKAKIEEKGLDVVLKKIVTSETTKLIATDKDKVKQVLSYILDNALKFTDTGEIKFGYSCAKSTITFFVEDTGIGISKSIQEVIFDRFKQIEQSHGGRVINSGLGLGLSISKEYVNIMGGNIWVESEEGKGSKFIFKIPCSFANS